MNALATDQAKRLAETIWGDERLNGKITAGLFIGEGKDKKKFPKEMGESHIIEKQSYTSSLNPSFAELQACEIGFVFPQYLLHSEFSKKFMICQDCFYFQG